MKKVIKDIVYCTIGELVEGSCDFALTINGEDLIDMDVKDALKIAQQNGLVKGEDVIIPSGLELTGTQNFGGAKEYNFNNGFIKVDLVFDGDEDEYIG